MSDSSLRGKTAVVTGASRGLGRRIAQALAAHGARVAMLARSSADLTAAAAEIGSPAVAIECDVADPSSVKAAFAAVARQFGGMNLLINNAAITELHKVEHASDASLARELAVNLAGPIYCCREAIPLLRAAGDGDIVNVTSESVERPFPYLTVYSATKGGLETFSAGLRAEVRPDGIRVMVLRVGHLAESGITRNWAPDTLAEYMQAIKRSGHLADTNLNLAPATVAAALVNALAMPRDARIGLIDIRSNVPASAR